MKRVCRVYALNDESPWEIYEPFTITASEHVLEIIAGKDTYTFFRRNIVAVIELEIEE